MTPATPTLTCKSTRRTTRPFTAQYYPILGGSAENLKRYTILLLLRPGFPAKFVAIILARSSCSPFLSDYRRLSVENGDTSCSRVTRQSQLSTARSVEIESVHSALPASETWNYYCRRFASGIVLVRRQNPGRKTKSRYGLLDGNLC